MPEHLKELAIILVAREWNSALEWTGHAVLAARAGGQPSVYRSDPHGAGPSRPH